MPLPHVIVMVRPLYQLLAAAPADVRSWPAPCRNCAAEVASCAEEVGTAPPPSVPAAAIMPRSHSTSTRDLAVRCVCGRASVAVCELKVADVAGWNARTLRFETTSSWSAALPLMLSCASYTPALVYLMRKPSWYLAPSSTVPVTWP